ncbi:S-methyl-5-thioribose-1-phosphate isomerase [Aurantimonas sp. VKM B-3413]|uniref:S-methyl-5-thioribose-1-phosphate isomerase n=1 Tax=Aurantimonas sp. VKM B-3413 TaxID=2779401 RepID=UPI001E59E7CF|nr:S-methyl-5-thioribose-1-phosphate isomerase [Aurantimonas sp. VKM B-3413]MCB8836399.1 S-methyl-5-thioribose-1-phosphate isomerase [Aurantimonas sp. VKM B-3413]
MRVGDRDFRSIWPEPGGSTVGIIDQTRLPHELKIVTLASLDDAATAIADMWVRGAPLIGATAAYGMAFALRADASDAGLDHAYDVLHAARPTAVNLRWALDAVRRRMRELPVSERADAAWAFAGKVCDEDVETNRQIGLNGLALIEAAARGKRTGEPVNILTHCNAGWLATVDWGTATSPIYQAFEKGIPVHVWVDETRPRNQGASLTAWELANHGVPHTLIVDNAGGHLMQHRKVDLCIVGSDRTTALGDVCNKIGTYLKALAARDNGVPFYAALPASTIDWTARNGVAEIPIEERSGEEVSHIVGMNDAGVVERVRIAPEATKVSNFAFDVTPARLVTGLITERGVCTASEAGLASLFPEFARKSA